MTRFVPRLRIERDKPYLPSATFLSAGEELAQKNPFNKANFLNVVTNLANANFGTITSAAPERNIQLALRLTF
jgi:hypothetical protein